MQNLPKDVIINYIIPNITKEKDLKIQKLEQELECYKNIVNELNTLDGECSYVLYCNNCQKPEYFNEPQDVFPLNYCNLCDKYYHPECHEIDNCN